MAEPTDALGLLSAALSASDSQVEARHLRQLYDLFQSQPGNIAPLFPSLFPLMSRASDQTKKWIVDVVDLIFCKPTLSPAGRAALSIHLPGHLLGLLQEHDLQHAKVAISVFASAYQPLFRHCCQDRAAAKLWPTIEAIKRRIVELFDSSKHMGVRLAALKAFQRIIIVQTRPNGSTGSTSAGDANISMVPPDHPTIRVSTLETEANERLTQVVTLIFTSSVSDLVIASMNSMSTLAKLRPSLSPIVLEALVSWKPLALTSLSFALVKNVEKTLRIIYLHFHPNRNSLAGGYGPQILEVLSEQKARMEAAAREEEARKEEEARARRERVDEEAEMSRKKVRFTGLEAEPDSSSSTPLRLNDGAAEAMAAATAAVATPTGTSDEGAIESANAFRRATQVGNQPNPLASFDVTTLPLHLVVELIIANLQAKTDAELQSAIERTRGNLMTQLPQPAPPPTLPKPLHPGAPPVAPSTVSKSEEAEEGYGQNPLQADLGEEEVAAQLSTEEEPESSLQALENFTLAAPSHLGVEDANALIRESIGRLCEGEELAISTAHAGASAPSSLWSTLLIRLATRGFTSPPGEANGTPAAQTSTTSQAESIRQLMLDFVKADFPRRITFASRWMAEEFHCYILARKQSGEQDRDDAYSRWLTKIVEAVIPTVDGKDKSLQIFLNQVPKIPDSVVSSLRQLCTDKAKMAVGFTMLRDMAATRLPARAASSDILLGLTRSDDRMTRNAAIITVRAWVENGGALEEKVLGYGRSGLKRLTVKNPSAGGHEGSAGTEENGKENGVVEGANGSTEKEEHQEEDGEIEAKKSSAADDPTKELSEEDDVVRFVALPFALCIKVPDMLDDIFRQFPEMPPAVQAAVQKHIQALIRSPRTAKLNSQKLDTDKLIDILSHYRPETSKLALTAFQVLTEAGTTPRLVQLVKSLAEEHDIDPRFFVPILPDLDKNEIIKYLPRVVTILNANTAESRETLKSVFTSIVEAPAQGFGSVSTNLPRVRQTELLTPVELMGLLHRSEKEIGLRTAAEAIRTCFGMTNVFRSEVLAAVLNQIVEEPVLPVLFMRTAIMAVKTYKSLSSYVSRTFLSRLILKKVWQTPLLWDGFALCVKQTAPGSFAALIQLPKEQLLDVLAKQPSLKDGLREYLTKKAGGNRARLLGYLEMLGEESSSDVASQSQSTTPTPGTPVPGSPFPTGQTASGVEELPSTPSTPVVQAPSAAPLAGQD